MPLSRKVWCLLEVLWRKRDAHKAPRVPLEVVRSPNPLGLYFFRHFESTADSFKNKVKLYAGLCVCEHIEINNVSL